MSGEIEKIIHSEVQKATEPAILEMKQVLTQYTEERREKFDSFESNIALLIEASIKKNVNGKIDKLSSNLESHMARVEPMLKNYENSAIAQAYLTQKSGLLIKLAGLLVAAGTIFVFVRYILTLNPPL